MDGLVSALAGDLYPARSVASGGRYRLAGGRSGAPAAAVGLIAALLHVHAMAGLMKRRMRPKLGASFVLIRLSWVMPLMMPSIVSCANSRSSRNSLGEKQAR